MEFTEIQELELFVRDLCGRTRFFPMCPVPSESAAEACDNECDEEASSSLGTGRAELSLERCTMQQWALDGSVPLDQSNDAAVFKLVDDEDKQKRKAKKDRDELALEERREGSQTVPVLFLPPRLSRFKRSRGKKLRKSRLCRRVPPLAASLVTIPEPSLPAL